VGSTRALHAQSLEPRAYAHTPIGLNFAIVGYGYTDGDVVLDAAVPVEGGNVSSNGLVLAYAKSFGLWGKSGKFDATLPYGWASGTATYRGEPVQRDVDGFGDPSLRFTWNFIGAPALTLSEFRTHHPGWLVGASLRVELPLGQYDADKAMNLGTNRWSFKPEVGASQALGPWILEGSFGVTYFTDNDDFFGGHARKQSPLYAAQAHLIYSFNPGLWAALDATYYAGGRTSVDGALNNDLQQNWRWGGTLSKSVDPRNSVKLYFSSGATARTGTNFQTVGIGWQHLWGAGV